MSTDSQGPPLSIFGNKFHSHFLGTGQKVPEVYLKKKKKEQVRPSVPLPVPQHVGSPRLLAGWQDQV